MTHLRHSGRCVVAVGLDLTFSELMPVFWGNPIPNGLMTRLLVASSREVLGEISRSHFTPGLPVALSRVPVDIIVIGVLLSAHGEEERGRRDG